MRIFFIGTVSFSKRAFDKLLSLQANIVGVATKSASAFNADHFDLAPDCADKAIPWKHVRDINAPHIVEWIKGLEPDIIFCFGWSSLIRKELLHVPRMGVVGFHASQLPHNKGRHPSIWAVVLGLEKSATSFFFMTEGADDGDILSQKPFTITYEDDALSVYKKIEENALLQLEKFLPQLQNGTYQRMRQNLDSGNVWRKRGMKDGEIDFRMSSFAIYNLVRGLTKPFIGAHLFYQGEEVKIWKVAEEEFNQRNIEPGKVLESKDNQLLVKTYDAAVRILEHNFRELPKVNEYL